VLLLFFDEGYQRFNFGSALVYRLVKCKSKFSLSYLFFCPEVSWEEPEILNKLAVVCSGKLRAPVPQILLHSRTVKYTKN
jgi:hypothetical protein